jgi:hypothetical protein
MVLAQRLHGVRRRDKFPLDSGLTQKRAVKTINPPLQTVFSRELTLVGASMGKEQG